MLLQAAGIADPAASKTVNIAKGIRETMQLLSREDFFSLISQPNAVEKDTSFTYSDFAKKSLDIYRSSSSPEEAFRKVTQRLLKPKCPPIKLVGKGSSRSAFCLQGGKCVKVAMNDAGIAQNAAEVKVFKSSEKYSCFPQVYDYERSLKTSLLTDCCTKARESDFKKLYGASLYSLCQIVDDFAKTERKPSQASAAAARNCRKDKYLMCDFDDEDAVEGICHSISEAKDPKWKCIHDWILFYYDMSRGSMDALLFSDLVRPENWGLRPAGRGQAVPVIIDAGFSKKVSKKYYS